MDCFGAVDSSAAEGCSPLFAGLYLTFEQSAPYRKHQSRSRKLAEVMSVSNTVVLIVVGEVQLAAAEALTSSFYSSS